MKEKNMMDAHRRLLNEAKEKIISAAKDISAVGITNGISAICSALIITGAPVGRDGDIHDWEVNLSKTLVRALKRMDEARDEINNAIEIVMENGGADEENEKDK